MISNRMSSNNFSNRSLSRARNGFYGGHNFPGTRWFWFEFLCFSEVLTMNIPIPHHTCVIVYEVTMHAVNPCGTSVIIVIVPAAAGLYAREECYARRVIAKTPFNNNLGITYAFLLLTIDPPHHGSALCRYFVVLTPAADSSINFKFPENKYNAHTRTTESSV